MMMGVGRVRRVGRVGLTSTNFDMTFHLLHTGQLLAQSATIDNNRPALALCEAQSHSQ